MTDEPDSIDKPSPGRTAVHQPGAVEVVRSEEQLQVGHDVHVWGRAVLRKYVVTETVTQTFQVRHEEVRLDVEPDEGLDSRTTEATTAGGRPFDDRVMELVLHREVPVVQLHVEATEKVRVHVDTVTEQVQVSSERRKEEVDVDVSGAEPGVTPELDEG